MHLRSLLPLVMLPLLACSSGAGSYESLDRADQGGPADGQATIQEKRSSLSRDTNPDASDEDVRIAAQASTELALKLVQASSQANVVLSPHSLVSALSMVSLGAVGDTQAQLRRAMQLPADFDAKLYPAINRIDLSLAAQAGQLRARPKAQGEASPGVGKLTVVNAAFQQPGLPVLDSYLDGLATHFGAGVQLLDFKNEPEAAKGAINAWVKEHTGGLIPNLLGEPLPRTSRLVLGNAVYFNGAFAAGQDFNPTRSRPRPFQTAGSVQNVPFLSVQAPRAFAEQDGAKVVSVAFDGAMELSVVLPSAPLDEYLAELSGARLHALLDAAQQTSRVVDLEVPRLKLLELPLNKLREPLKALGAEMPFDARVCDFSAMTQDGAGLPLERLYLDDVMQKTTFDLDEAGVEAAAVTLAVMGGATSAPEEPEDPFVLHADRPFLLTLRDRLTGQLLFLARISDPSQQ